MIPVVIYLWSSTVTIKVWLQPGVGEVNETVVSGPPYFRDAVGLLFESFALSFSIVLNLVHKLQCETYLILLFT